jgi:hypothetical protein
MGTDLPFAGAPVGATRRERRIVFVIIRSASSVGDRCARHASRAGV